MTTETVAPEWGEHAPKPIASGSAFIGLMAARNAAVQMLWWRVSFGLTLNLAGLLGAGYQLGNRPSTILLTLMWLGAVFGAISNRYWRVLLNSAQVAVEHWTEELVQLEERNGFEGGCRVFQRVFFPAPGRKPRVPKVLRSIRYWCIFSWSLIVTLISAMLVSKTGVLTCSVTFSQFCS